MSRKTIQEYVLAIGAAVAVALALRTFILEAYRVPTEVMAPTLLPGDFVFAAKWPFIGAEPDIHHGQILIYRPAADLKQSYIGRVVGLAGDKIEIRAGVVHWNGQELKLQEVTTSSSEAHGNAACGIEPHPKGSYRVCVDQKYLEIFETVEVPAGQVFLMTDYRGRTPERTRPPSALLPLGNLKAEPRRIWLSIDPEAPGVFPKLRFSRLFKRIQ